MFDTILLAGASSGIGSALLNAVVTRWRPRRVIAASRVPDATRLCIPDSGEACQVDALCIDYEDERTLATASTQLRDAGVTLNAIINCVGLLHDGDSVRPERALGQLDPDAAGKLFTVNALGPLLLAKHFSPLLEKQTRLLFASLSARVGSIGDNRLGGWYSYRMSKAAHNMAIANLSIELKRRLPGIMCVALHPGTVDTRLSAPFRSRNNADAWTQPEQAALNLCTVIEGLTEADNGKFLAWDGQEIAW